MKENYKKILKILISILLFILGVVIIAIIYSLIFEQKKIAIDRYNFEQLVKVKEIINNDKNFNMVSFPDLYNFNYIYNSDIKPIKNCYYLSSDNGKYEYIFGFQLESLIYKFKYFRNNYIYPKYDIPIHQLCTGLRQSGCFGDLNYSLFIETISNPCRD